MHAYSFYMLNYVELQHFNVTFNVAITFFLKTEKV